ncbi:MBL fold metallo-hydrolase [Halobellus sp. H-GB7]|uniref:MBL fold metallo-hydrolase n=1 Tax=Halobellus sp. H-GB7 TaxID=3069756 RepID=UPI0027B0CAEA|nr:MBL fold metallo-hydrolase [Halobellus sp. H-GB7]MDQ2054625.1 MBL fold metallo-hydrolase [Halobellus sp. H-GB7]
MRDATEAVGEGVTRMEITVLYDNERARTGVHTGWGFSALVGDDVLFDTGDDAAALGENMAALDVTPTDIDTVVLSHGHDDHVGGLPAVVEQNPEVDVVVPTESLATTVSQSVPETVDVIAAGESTQVREGVVTTGAVGEEIREQGLVCRFQRGAVLLTGCAHPGLESLLGAARDTAAVVGVMGGFHDFARLEALRRLDFVSPCHCTQKKQEITERFPDTTVRCGTGLVVGEDGVGSGAEN